MALYALSWPRGRVAYRPSACSPVSQDFVLSDPYGEQDHMLGTPNVYDRAMAQSCDDLMNYQFIHCVTDVSLNLT